MATHHDVIIIGTGAMGSCAAWRLARRGINVLALEQFSIAHALGSSHGETRMIRLAYYEHPDYVPLLKRAYELWREMEGESRRDLLFEVGGIYVSKQGGEVVRGAITAARQHNLSHEPLTPAEVKKRWPQFQIPEDFLAVYEPRAGFLLPEKVVATAAELALRHGVTLHAHERVISWNEDSTGVTVRTDRAEYHADHLIVSAGPWTSQMLRDLGIKLTVTRQVMGWTWPLEPDNFELGKFPVWAVERTDGSLDYGFPIVGLGVKTAHHGPATPTDPDTVDRNVQPGDEEDFRHALSRYLRSANGPTLAIKTCLYTNSPDSHFIIGRHPNHQRVTIACGFSGHGFKFASVIGEVLADLSTTGRTNLPIDFLSPVRFG